MYMLMIHSIAVSVRSCSQGDLHFALVTIKNISCWNDCFFLFKYQPLTTASAVRVWITEHATTLCMDTSAHALKEWRELTVKKVRTGNHYSLLNSQDLATSLFILLNWYFKFIMYALFTSVILSSIAVIDNCVVNNTCSKGQVCISQVGSHECVCLDGFYGKKCDKGKEKKTRRKAKKKS